MRVNKLVYIVLVNMFRRSWRARQLYMCWFNWWYNRQGLELVGYYNGVPVVRTNYLWGGR